MITSLANKGMLDINWVDEDGAHYLHYAALLNSPVAAQVRLQVNVLLELRH